MLGDFKNCFVYHQTLFFVQFNVMLSMRLLGLMCGHLLRHLNRDLGCRMPINSFVRVLDVEDLGRGS